MKVKVGEKVFDTDREPIMLIFDDNEEKNQFVENII